MVLCVPYYGYAWTLVNPEENGIGAPATGPALKKGGSVKYKKIKNYIKRYGDGAKVIYSSTYVEYLMNFSGQKKQLKRRLPQLFVFILTKSTAAVLLILCFLIYYRRMTKLRLKTGTMSTDTGDSDKKLKYQVNSIAAAKDLTTSVPNLIVYSLADIEAATDRYTSENKLGKGGYGPVYKVTFY
ncbi:hypothetical protein ACOSQ4_012556 [Xanthoceras sorbifolium]